LSYENTAISDPLFYDFPHITARCTERRDRDRIGYFGRISDDKNIPHVLDAFAMLYSNNRRASLHLAGEIDPTSALGSAPAIVTHLAKRGVPKNALKIYGFLPKPLLWPFLADIDVFIFPAIASVESLARVLLEAQYAGVPAVAAHYAAAAEILPETNLILPDFTFNRTFDTLSPFSFGGVAVNNLVSALSTATIGYSLARSRQYQRSTFIALLQGAHNGYKTTLSHLTKAFIDAVLLDDLTLPDSFHRNGGFDRVLRTFSRYNSNNLLTRVVDRFAIASQPRYPQRHALYTNRLLFPNERGGLGHAREHCWSLGFMPKVTLSKELFYESLRGNSYL